MIHVGWRCPNVEERRVCELVEIFCKIMIGCRSLLSESMVTPVNRAVNERVLQISWCNKKQPTVSLSTREVEYRAVTGAAQECTRLKLLIERLAPEN